MKTISVLCLLLCIMPLSAKELKVGTQWPELRTTDGKVFWNVKFTYVSPRDVRFMHTAGVSTLPLGEMALPEDVTVMATPVASATALGPVAAAMTQDERKSSGIEKLSSEEQAVLARWMQQTVGDLLEARLEGNGAQPSTFRLTANTSADMAAVPAPGELADATPARGPAAPASADTVRPALPAPGSTAPASLRGRVPAPVPGLLPPPAPVALPTTSVQPPTSVVSAAPPPESVAGSQAGR